jgi:hypothetical protein
MGKEKSFLRQWLASESIASESIASDSIAGDAAASTSAPVAGETSDEAGAAADKPGQPTLREVLGAINRIVREDGTARAGAGAGAGASTREQSTPQKTKIVAKLTTPLGKAQRDNLLVMSLLGLDVILGATFGLIGYFGLESDSIAMAGAVVVLIGIVAMALYQRFGRER